VAEEIKTEIKKKPFYISDYPHMSLEHFLIEKAYDVENGKHSFTNLELAQLLREIARKVYR
jgi:hypothetical protein